MPYFCEDACSFFKLPSQKVVVSEVIEEPVEEPVEEEEVLYLNPKKILTAQEIDFLLEKSKELIDYDMIGEFKYKRGEKKGRFYETYPQADKASDKLTEFVYSILREIYPILEDSIFDYEGKFKNLANMSQQVYFYPVFFPSVSTSKENPDSDRVLFGRLKSNRESTPNPPSDKFFNKIKDDIFSLKFRTSSLMFCLSLFKDDPSKQSKIVDFLDLGAYFRSVSYTRNVLPFSILASDPNFCVSEDVAKILEYSLDEDKASLFINKVDELFPKSPNNFRGLPLTSYKVRSMIQRGATFSGRYIPPEKFLEQQGVSLSDLIEICEYLENLYSETIEDSFLTIYKDEGVLNIAITSPPTYSFYENIKSVWTHFEEDLKVKVNFLSNVLEDENLLLEIACFLNYVRPISHIQ